MGMSEAQYAQAIWRRDTPPDAESRSILQLNVLVMELKRFYAHVLCSCALGARFVNELRECAILCYV